MSPDQLKAILSKLRKYEIRIRKVIDARMQGDFHSVFKGSGIEFDDVRAYQYGDDVRTIEWNVSAKGHGTFVKTFKEEKEQAILFMMDVSASQDIGRLGQTKMEIGREICGVLALAGIKEKSQSALLLYSDQKEKYIRPGKGLRHGYEIIAALYDLVPKGTRTNLTAMVHYALSVMKRRSVVVLVSDFIDSDYEPALRALARRHDLICIHIADRLETVFPKLGIIPLYDKERRKSVWLNTSAEWFSGHVSKPLAENRQRLEDFCKRNRANYLYIQTDEEYVDKLIRLFRNRKKL
jgi:uncharacterized protein (DUF58 family)